MDRKKLQQSSKKEWCGTKLPPISDSSDYVVKTILDIDPHFYTLVDGRPIRSNKSINQYKKNIRDIALKRTVHGFLSDEILRITKEIDTERKIYSTASKHFDEYHHSFDKFLADDNNKTIIIMRKSDNLAKELSYQTEEHKQANFELATLKSKLQYIDETFQILVSFQSFLHRAAPILWQEKHKINYYIEQMEIIVYESDIFKKINKNLIILRLEKYPLPRLYFESPEQLLHVFDMLEKQNLNYLLVTEELNTEKNKFLKSLGFLKYLIHKELDYIQEKIQEIAEMITLNEKREVELKEAFFRILHNEIRYLVSSEMVLQIFNYVEFAYEQVIAPNDAKLSSLDMALALETEYNNLMLDLSVFDLDVIKTIEKETYENEIKHMKEAQNANKLLKDVDKLSKRLKSSYEPRKRKDNNDYNKYQC